MVTAAAVTMAYDGDFMRRKRQDGNAVTNYLWDGAQVLIETDGGNTTAARYTLAPFGYGDLVAQRRSSATLFFHFDAIGTMRALTDSSQAVTDTAIYRAFGIRVASTGSSTTPYRWVGKLGYATDARMDGHLLRRRWYWRNTGYDSRGRRAETMRNRYYT